MKEYFQHDYHSRHDPKLTRIQAEMGMEGIGLYWCLIELMYELGEPLDKRDDVIHSKSLQINSEQLKLIRNIPGLWKTSRSKWWSEGVVKRIEQRRLKQEKARGSALIRWNAKAERPQCKRNANIREEKRIEENRNTEPTAAPVNNLGDTIKKKPVSKDDNLSSLRQEVVQKMQEVYEKGLNIFSLLNKLKKETRVGTWLPDDVLLRVCNSYLNNNEKIENDWAWFTRAIVAEWEGWNAEKNIREGAEFKKTGVAESIKDIFRKG